MSRSKHTDPLPIRAKRRVQSPREPRSAGDPSLRQRLGRMLKEKGIVHAHGDGGAQARPTPRHGPKTAIGFLSSSKAGRRFSSP
jgi:hypothetical protein